MRKAIGSCLGLVLIGILSMGMYLLADNFGWVGTQEQKPVIPTQNAELRMDAATPIILEREYSRSHKVVISDFDNKQDVIGSSLEAIRSKYTPDNGFNISLKDGSLIIRQTIDDWTPDDKLKCRFKAYQGMVAIYVGPDSTNDSLLKVTAIRFSTLPSDIRAAIEQGQYEFENDSAINDALENLDEY